MRERTDRAAVHVGPQGSRHRETRGPRPAQAGRVVPVVARQDELRVISEGLAAARRGDGTLMLLQGPPGIGKTHLLAAAKQRARDAGMVVLSARGAELEADLPFGVLTQLVDPHLETIGEEQRSALFSGHAARAAALFDGSASRGPVIAAASDDPLAEILHALYWLCARIAARRPALLVVDDAQWADLPSLRWLHYLSGRLDGQQLFVMIAARSDDHSPRGRLVQAIGQAPQAAGLTLPPLDPEAVAVLARTGLGASTPPEVCAACFTVTGGNPFLLSQLLRGLLRGTTPPTADAVLTAEVAEVSGAVRAQVRRESPPAQNLLHALTVAGDGTPLTVVATLAGTTAEAAASTVQSLVALGVLAHGETLRFLHPLVRASVGAQVPADRRSDLHARAARLLHERGAADDVVALHLAAADPSGDPWAVEVLLRTAERAIVNGAPEVAADHLRRALAEPPTQEMRPEVLLQLGRATAAQLAPDAHDDLGAALDAAPAGIGLATAAFELGRILVMRERATEAIAALDRGAAAARVAGDRELELRIEAEALAAANISLDRARIAPRRAAALAPVVAGGRTLGERLVLCGVAWERALSVAAPADEVAGLASRALAGGATVAIERAESPSFVSAVATLIIADDFAAAERHLTVAMDDARARQSVGGLAMAACWRAWSAYRRGAIGEAQVDAALSIRLASHNGGGLGAAISLSVLMECLMAQGDVAGAAAALDQWMEPATMSRSTLFGPLLASRARLSVLQGDLQAAEADFRACGERSEALGLRNPGAGAWRSGRAWLALVQGDRAQAAALAGEELAISRAFGAPRSLGQSLRSVAAAAASPAQQRAALEEAIAILTPSQAQLELARCRHALGALLAGQGDLAAARPLLHAALDGATRSRAWAAAIESRAALVAAGGRPRRVAQGGIETLSPSERRIADLVCAGTTNREIADQEFLAIRTVEQHLTSAYRKLGVNSRRALTAAMER